MLTPEFKLSQNDTHVNVNIRLPYVKVSSAQFYIQSKMFKFYLKPYLLTLGFQQNLKQMQQPSKAVYYYQKHILSVDLEKQNKGEYFQNLNLISSLMEKKQNKKTKDKRVLVQVISQNKKGNIITQELGLQNPFSYGFCSNYTGVFKDLNQQSLQIFMFDPSSVSKDQRYELSRKIVFETFDENAYMFDKVSNFDQIDRILDSKSIQKLNETILKLQKQPYTFEKFKAISKIPNKEIILNNSMKQALLKQLISIGFCFLYQYQCMQGQFGVQSAKTINQTSAVLSCNVTYDKQNITEILNDCCRRCVTFSLYKNIEICQKIFRHLGDIISKNFLLQMLLQLRILFQKSQPRYLLNRIYIDDFCTYLLNLNGGLNEQFEKNLIKMKKQVKQSSNKLSEKSLELDLEEEEQQGEIQQQQVYEQSSSKMIDNELQNLLSLD